MFPFPGSLLLSMSHSPPEILTEYAGMSAWGGDGARAVPARPPPPPNGVGGAPSPSGAAPIEVHPGGPAPPPPASAAAAGPVTVAWGTKREADSSGGSSDRSFSSGGGGGDMGDASGGAGGFRTGGLRDGTGPSSAKDARSRLRAQNNLVSGDGRARPSGRGAIFTRAAATWHRLLFFDS